MYDFVRQRVNRAPCVPEASIEFAIQTGLDSCKDLLDDPSSGWTHGLPTNIEILTASRRQLLGELHGMVKAGARLDFELSGHTPLTACVSGWIVRKVPGCFPKRVVAAFLLEQCPVLAHMREPHTYLSEVIREGDRAEIGALISLYRSNRRASS